MARKMNETPCGNPHAKRKAKLLAGFGKAKAGTVVEADVCPVCGVYVRSKAIGLDDEGAWMVPSELAELEG
jgi:hypothetical protein